MNSIIKKIFYDISEENKVLKDNHEYEVLNYENDKLYNLMCEGLTKEQIKKLEDLLSNDLCIQAETNEAYFMKGYKLGVLTILECLDGK